MNADAPSRSSLVLVSVAAAAVIVAAVTTTVVVTHSDTGAQHTVAAPPNHAPWTAVETGSSAKPAADDAARFSYLPLWPFAGQADAAAWQSAYRSGGRQPWHLDAGQTALSFTQGYLGYTHVDQVVHVTAAGQQSWVSVGFDDPNGQPVTSAVLHLARLGTGTDAPWEVVGSRDTTLTLTAPAYGATVRSPVTTGGQVTGVDESLRVQLRQLGRPDPVGRTDGVPAGGDRARWTVQASFTAPAGSTLTIAVSTGGHIAEVERFAITGVRS